MFNASSVSFSGSVATFLLAGGFLLTLEAQQPPASAPPTPAASHQTFVTRYCASCHNDRLKRGGLTLDGAAANEVDQNPDVWEKVVRKVRARQMPPVGLPRPDEATYNAEVAALETALDRAAAAQPNPGRTETLRRLNRTEYQNAIRDLLALDVDVASLLPPTSPVTASTTSRWAIFRRRCSTATSRRRRRSAALAVGRPRAFAGRRYDPDCGRTSRRRSTSRVCRSARAAVR